MSKETMAAAPASGLTEADLEVAVEQAREQAAMQERERIKSILQSAAANDRMKTALSLAFNPNMTLEDANRILETVPPEPQAGAQVMGLSVVEEPVPEKPVLKSARQILAARQTQIRKHVGE